VAGELKENKMARYPHSGLHLSRIYIVLALLIIAVVIVFIYKPYHFGKNETSAAPNNANVPDINKVISPGPPKTRLEPNSLEILTPTAEDNPRVTDIIAEAINLIGAKPSRIIDARDRLNESLLMPMSSQQRVYVKSQLSAFADKWLFSRTIFPEDKLCSSYQVKPSDQLRTIGEQFKVPYEILMQINNIPRPEALQAGETLKVINGPFHARVYRSAFTIDLFLQNTFVRSFSVGLGKPGRETPTGLWLVEPGGKLVKPPWTDPDTGRRYQPDDPDYPLGSRWIGLKGIEGLAKDRTGFAIHGTKDPNQIGSAGSRGCIRLHNGDVILVYNLLMPGESKVEVVE
jgi:LysM repeat protein